MSYDISLVIDTGSDDPAVLTDWNYTSNCGPMWRAAGADLADFHDKPVTECLPILTAAINELLANPGVYEAMNPENGWGSYASLVPALQRLEQDFRRHPKATVYVSR